MGSSRFPGKPLARINGVPMLAWVYRAATMALSIDQTYVATADNEIIEYCEREQMRFMATSPACRTGTLRVADAAGQLALDPMDVVLNVQGDEPMLRSEWLNDLAAKFRDPSVNLASLCFRPEGAHYLTDRNRVKVLMGRTNVALFFGREIRTSIPVWEHFRQHIGVYGFRAMVLERIKKMDPDTDLEQRPWVRAEWNIHMVEIPDETIAVDTPADLKMATAALAARAGNSA